MAPTIVTESQMSDARLLLSWGVVQAVLEDKQDAVGGSLVDILEQCVQENLRQCEKWSQTLLKDLLGSKTAAAQIKELNEHMKDYLNQSFRQRYVNLSSRASTPGKPFEAHIPVMRRLQSELSRKLQLEGTSLLDRLFECDMLSESDRQSILANPTDKRKNEAFIDFLCSNFTAEAFRADVLPLLSQEQVHQEISARILHGLEDAASETETIRCTFCKMKALVDPRKLAEALYEQNSISQSLKKDLYLSTQPSSSKWEEILKNVKKGEQLLKALKKTYPHLAWEFEVTGHEVLKCCCFDIRQDVAQMSDFTSDEICDDMSDVSSHTLRDSPLDATSSSEVMPSHQRTTDQSLVYVRTDQGAEKSEFVNVVSTDLKIRSEKFLLPRPQIEMNDGEEETIQEEAEQDANKKAAHHSEVDIQKDKSELIRLENERKELEQKLATVTDQIKTQDIQGQITRVSRLVGQRKELLHLAVKHKTTMSEIKQRILEHERDYEQERVLFKKVNASRLLESAKKELDQVQTDYDEKRHKIESACVVM